MESQRPVESGVLDQNGSNGGDENWSGWEYSLEVEPTAFREESKVDSERDESRMIP